MEIKEMVAHAFNLATTANNGFAQGQEQEAMTELVNLRDYLDENLPKEQEEVTE